MVSMARSIDRYFGEVAQLELPTRASERADFLRYVVLRKQIAQTPDLAAKQVLQREYEALGRKLAEGYVRFVIGKARDRIRSRPQDHDLLSELISAGNEGLLIARDRFDPAFKTHFLTYAAYWVRVKMDEFEHRRQSVHVSVHLRKQRSKRDDIPPDPIMTPDEDVQLADERVEVDRRAFDRQGKCAFEILSRVSLSRLERFVLTLSLGLRNVPREDPEVQQIIYTQTGCVLSLVELRQLKLRALNRLQVWVDQHPEAVETLTEG